VGDKEWHSEAEQKAADRIEVSGFSFFGRFIVLLQHTTD
jgi:hypothetical protein